MTNPNLQSTKFIIAIVIFAGLSVLLFFERIDVALFGVIVTMITKDYFQANKEEKMMVDEFHNQ